MRIGVATPQRVEWENTGRPEAADFRLRSTVVVKLLRGNSAKGVLLDFPEDAADDLCPAHRSVWIEPGPLPVGAVPSAGGEGMGCLMPVLAGRATGASSHRRWREDGNRRVQHFENRGEFLAGKKWHIASLDAMDWDGLGMVEFKFDTEKREKVVHRSKPSFTGLIDLAVASGIDLPALLYLAAT